MNKLAIKYFKAFKNEVEIDLDNKNLLIYGENGAGKSSIYEALKIIFFKDKLAQSISNAPTQEDQEQVNRDYWSKYNNRNTNRDFEISVNGTNYLTFSTVSYQVFMISLYETFFENKIEYKDFLRNTFSDIDPESFCTENYLYIQEDVNEALELFQEHIKIEIDNEDDFTIKVIDTVRNIESKAEIKQYFNEAKLNLIVLLLILTSFRYAKDTTKKKILVLDDFITSLDIANRTFLMKYIFDNFTEFQIIMLTHNINFYNLTQYLINDIYKTNQNWRFANIYEFNNDNKLFLKNSIKKVSEIKQLYETDRRQVEQVGNEIRQKFEVLLYEFSKILMIGAVEDSSKILEHLENSKNLYFNNGKTESELIEDLISIIDRTYPAHVDIKPILRSKIGEYKQNDFPNLQQILKQLKLYRKVTMHPMSHGTVGQTAFTTKEIEQSLDLLERFETRLEVFVDKNVSGI